MRRSCGLLLLYILLTGCAAAETFLGKVVAATDGDTLGVMRESREVTVRLYGVDTPEFGQDFATNAKQFTSSPCFGVTVVVDIRDTDRYGRTVGVVNLADGRVLNHELVRAGLAWWYRQYAPDDAFLTEEGAKLKLAGADTPKHLASSPALSEPLGAEALAFAKDLIKGKEVGAEHVRAGREDKSRKLVYLRCDDGELLSIKLLQLGLARVDGVAPADRAEESKTVEQQAR